MFPLEFWDPPLHLRVPGVRYSWRCLGPASKRLTVVYLTHAVSAGTRLQFISCTPVVNLTKQVASSEGLHSKNGRYLIFTWEEPSGRHVMYRTSALLAVLAVKVRPVITMIISGQAKAISQQSFPGWGRICIIGLWHGRNGDDSPPRGHRKDLARDLVNPIAVKPVRCFNLAFGIVCLPALPSGMVSCHADRRSDSPSKLESDSNTVEYEEQKSDIDPDAK